MSKLKKISRIRILLLGVLVLAFLFRFYHLTDWFAFGMDQEYEAFLAKNIVEGAHFPLIGVNAADTGLYLGPLFIYFSALPYLLFGGNPAGFAIFASSLGVMTTLVVFLVAKKMVNRRAALLAAFFYAVSFLTSYYDRQYWNPMLMPLFSLLIGYFLYRSMTDNKKYLLAAAFFFGLGLHSHLSVWMLAPLILFLTVKYKRHFGRKIIIWAVAVFLLLQLPLLLFELRHDFPNLKAFFSLLSQIRGGGLFASFSDRIRLLFNTLGRFVWIPPRPDLFLENGQCRELTAFRKDAYPEIILLALAGIGLFIKVAFHKMKSFFSHKRLLPDNLGLGIIGSVLLLGLAAVIFYPGAFFEYYLLWLLPYLAIILGVAVESLWRNEDLVYLGATVCFMFLLGNVITLGTAFSSYSYTGKMAVLDYSQKAVEQEEYSLEALGECPRFGGWRYLYEHYVGKPVHSYMDSYYDWLYYDRKQGNPGKIVLLSMIDPRLPNELLVKWQESKLQFLTEFNILSDEIYENVHVFILSPKK